VKLTPPKREQAVGNSNLNLDDHAFAMKIATALQAELKDPNSRAKLVAGWTGANERTVKNWVLGRYGPCGRHLVLLARHSRSGAECHFVNGGSTGSGSGSEGRVSQAKGF
jgi:hypothetical protein